MTDIKQAPVKQLWGTFETSTNLVQTYPGCVWGKGEKIIHTRTWSIGDKVHIPVISGDSIRGRLRNQLADHLLEHVGVEPADIPLATAHLFYVGGALSGTENLLTPQVRDTIRELFPMLALLGGTPAGGWLHGRLRAGRWVAQTRETPRPAIIADLQDEPLRDAASTTVVESFSRSGFPDAGWKNDGGVGNRVNKDSKGENGTTGTVLSAQPHTTQTVLPGVTFAGWVSLADYRGLTPDADAVQRSCLRYGLQKAFPQDKTVELGLQKAAGNGVVTFDWKTSLDAISDDVDGKLYLDHLDANRAKIVEKLTSNALVPTVKKPKKSGSAGKSAVPAETIAEDDTADTDTDE